MNEVNAAEELRTIRILMERSALYRRALGPLYCFAGAVASITAGVGYFARLDHPMAFVVLWGAVGVSVLLASFAWTRQQALRAAEPVWTPPARRFALSMAPALFVGAAGTLLLLKFVNQDPGHIWALPLLWLAGYGLALNAAGACAVEGLQRIGIAFLGSALLLGISVGFNVGHLSVAQSHLWMGMTFGVIHLVAGLRRLRSERRQDP